MIKDSIDDSILEEEIDSDGERLEDRGARQKSVDDGVIGDMEKGMVDENIGEKEESVVDEHFKRNEISDIEGEMGVYEKTEIEGDVGASEKNVTEEITDASEKTDIGEDVDAANDNEDSGSTDVPGESVIDADAKARRRTVVEPLIVKEYSHPLDSTSGHRKVVIFGVLNSGFSHYLRKLIHRAGFIITQVIEQIEFMSVLLLGVGI